MKMTFLPDQLSMATILRFILVLLLTAGFAIVAQAAESIQSEFYIVGSGIHSESVVLTRIRVTLDDGLRCSEVFVAWGNESVKVGSSEVPKKIFALN